MAKCSRPIWAARRAVLSDPECTAASTTSPRRKRRNQANARGKIVGVARLALDQEVGPMVRSGASGAEGPASGGATRSPTAIGPVAETSRPYDMPSNKRNTNT